MLHKCKCPKCSYEKVTKSNGDFMKVDKKTCPQCKTLMSTEISKISEETSSALKLLQLVLEGLSKKA